MRRHVLCASLLVLCCSSQVSAQPKPDFNGTWAVVSLPRWMKQFETADAKLETVIKQSALMVSLVQRIVSTATAKPIRPDLAPTILYLDGHERRSRQTDGSVHVTRTFWDGQVLVTTIATTKDGRTTSTNTTKWSIDRDGLLVIEGLLDNGKSQQPARDFMTLKRK